MRAHLAGLDVGVLAALLDHRPDLLVEPAPRDVGELAHRLNGADSLARALREMTSDELVTARVIALLGTASLATLVQRVRAPATDLGQVVNGLCARGLAWTVGGQLALPERLTQHFARGLVGFQPLDAIARQTRVDDLRVAITGLGSDPAGLRKVELVECLAALVSDPAVVSRAVASLPAPARRHLEVLCQAGGHHYLDGSGHGAGDPTTVLLQVGLLVVGPFGRPELPREIAVAMLLDGYGEVTGRPELAAATDPPDSGRAAADIAVLALTTVLDEARNRPLAALKKGGIGTRERTRLATRLAVPDPALWIDIADAAGLLDVTPHGYAAAEVYDSWREEPPSTRWAAMTLAWFAVDVAPTSRETDGGEVPPPLPLESAGGMLRRALLRAAAGGTSVRAAGERIDWFCPLHSYNDTGRDRKLAAAVHEATLLGVVTGDRLSALGELLVEVADRPDAAVELARRGAELLPEARGLLVLQSDLTALVSGQTSAAAARLLADAATSESRGVAATWRFTPTSVRAALDAGWTAQDLRAELVAVSGRDLPQPLDYLLSDVARRHGNVRLRGSRSCVIGSEADIAEILHTRSLRTLHLSRLAPTVLSSPFELDVVLTKLRGAGFLPMPEDADGVVIVPERVTHSAAAPARRTRGRVSAADLAARLLDTSGAAEQPSGTYAQLAELARHLDSAEVTLLADALDHGLDIRIRYRNKDGNRSIRDVAPRELYGRWLTSWCYLRSDEREFAVANIESVSPVG